MVIGLDRILVRLTPVGLESSAAADLIRKHLPHLPHLKLPPAYTVCERSEGLLTWYTSL